MILNTNHGLLSPQSPPLASRKPPNLPDLETLQFPPRLYREPSPHSQECLCHQEDAAGHPLQNPGRRPRQSYNRPSLVERSNHRCPHNRNASQGRIHSPPVLPPFFCGHAQPRPYSDLAKRSAVSNHQWHQRCYVASREINPRPATKTFLARRVLRPLGPLSRTVRHHPRLHREQSRQGRLGRSSRGLALVQLHRHLRLNRFDVLTLWHRHSWLCSHPLPHSLATDSDIDDRAWCPTSHSCVWALSTQRSGRLQPGAVSF